MERARDITLIAGGFVLAIGLMLVIGFFLMTESEQSFDGRVGRMPASPPLTPVPDEPRCKVTLTLVSMTVREDTEAGPDEWSVAGSAQPGPVSQSRIEAIQADVGDRDGDGRDNAVTVNREIGSETYPKRQFPWQDAWIIASAKEVDSEALPLMNESGVAMADGYRIHCPDSRTVDLAVAGSGPDPLVVETFVVDLQYKWEVVEVAED